jgi:pimeloyl-ACP methyl ester carboxylesterase
MASELHSRPVMDARTLLRTALMAAAESLAENDGEAVPATLEPNRQPIVLLQGFASSSLCLLPLEAHLRARLGRPVVRLRLGGRIAAQLGCIRSSAQRVVDLLEDLAQRPGFQHADLVGHSMGGLVAAYALKRLDRKRRIRRVITLGAPHRGTPLALPGTLLFGAFSRAIWQMLPGSTFLRELESLSVPAGSELVAVGASADGIVPGDCAHLTECEGQRNHVLEALDHLDFLHHMDAHAFVEGALADEVPTIVPLVRPAVRAPRRPRHTRHARLAPAW